MRTEALNVVCKEHPADLFLVYSFGKLQWMASGVFIIRNLS